MNMSDTLNRLISIVGKDRVVENPEFTSDTAGYKAVKESMQPEFLVKPSNTEQVQKIVKMANESATPIIPVSSRGPHKTGGVSASAPGAVVVDLSGMNKILKVNRRHRLALIQPGVTWDQLAVELAENGLRIPQPLLPKRGKSVIASLLDREPLLSPKYQWNMTEPLRSMEIVFGTGDIVYSGMGGHRGEKEENWENGEIPVTNAGPHQFDFIKMVTASQGTFGIVTWASVRVEAAATAEKPVFAEAASLDSLSDYIYKNLKFRFGDEVCLFNRKAMASILSGKGDTVSLYDSKLSNWTAMINIKWGALRAKEKVEVQEADVLDIAQENGLIPSASVAGLPSAEVSRKVLALPAEENWKDRKTGKSKEIFFLSTLDKIPGQLKAASSLADKYGYAFSECPVYIQPLHQGTAAHCHIVLPVTGNEAESEEFAALYRDLSKELMNAGAFYSRPYGIWADLVYDRNAQNTILNNKMKDIFDPEHIMNPGKLCF